MTEQQEGMQEQPETAEQPALHIGRILAAERERQERSLADVARALRLGVKQVEALETNDFGALPGNTFVRGFIRNYARLLELDAEPLLQAFQQKAPEEAHAVSVPPRGGEFSPYPSKRWMWYAGAVGLMVLGAPLLVYSLLSGGSAPTPPARPAPVAMPRQQVPMTAVSVPPVAQMETVPAEPADMAAKAENQATIAPAATQAAADTTASRIVLRFEAEAWAEVRDKDHNRLLGQLNPAGTEQVVEGTPPFSVVIGNAAHVKVLFNDTPIDLAPHIDAEVARFTLK